MITRNISLNGLIAALTLLLAVGLFAAENEPGRNEMQGNDPGSSWDLSKDRVLYAVGYAHLDTQWRWDYVTTIDKYIKDTLVDNFQRFEDYPEYVFSFTGSVRYEMMKEYYPELYERMKDYIAQGRWFVSGSSVDEGDVNVPSPESVIRHVLYGNRYFRREFDKESRDFMLPDCFGFQACMPSIWAHCGLDGFSTQKLTWGSAVGVPFSVGVWEGLDGGSVMAGLNPGSYASAMKGEVERHAGWSKRIEENGINYGVFADFHYYGVGDVGGAPRAADVARYTASARRDCGLYRVALTSSDQLFKDITAEQRKQLPRYRGDLLLTEHSAGTLSSQAYMKRWNRKNEQLADAAERAAVTAAWFGGAAYPREKLERGWVRVLASQMHDILPGTSIPEAYEFSWNDEVLGLNHFAAVLEDSVGAVVRGLDTANSVLGRAVVVYNPLALEREDLVEATVGFPEGAPAAVRVFGSDGRETPSQVLTRGGNEVTVLFLAEVPPVGFATFDVRSTNTPCALATGLAVSGLVLENACYRVTLDDAGDVASIRDKLNGDREILAAPAGLEFQYEKPKRYPAWNMDWDDRQQPPFDHVAGPAECEVTEKGPVRVAIRVRREARDSIFVQEIRLAAGDAGRRVEFDTEIDWQSTTCSLKAAFPLAVNNSKATYNMGLGTIRRRTNDPKKYEVPSREWFDLTDASGEYGVTVLEDCKFGSDKPDGNTLRLTLLFTPGVRRGYKDQATQDWGRHEMLYALYGHIGDWREGRSEWQGRRVNQPLIAFEAPRHAGPLGNRFSLVSVDTPQVDVRALKMAEESDHVIVRLQELWGRNTEEVRLSFAGAIREAYEVDGQERAIGKAEVREGKLVVRMTPYSPRSFAVALGGAPCRLAAPACTAVPLDFDEDVVSTDANRTDGDLDGGRSIPAEMLPERIVSEGVDFVLGGFEEGGKNALACKGQTVALPAGDFERVYLLAAAAGDQDVPGLFHIGGIETELTIQPWTGFIGQWDNRVWNRSGRRINYRSRGGVDGLETGYIKRDTVAWFCTHRHAPDRNESYRFSYLFKYGLPLPKGARTLTLPDDRRIKIFAVTLAGGVNDAVSAAQPLYDDFDQRRDIVLRVTETKDPGFGLPAIGRVTVDRKDSFKSLSMGAPRSDDYADVHAGHDVEISYVQHDRLAKPHPRAGAADALLPRLNDGERAQNRDDTQRTVWFDNGEGRFIMDLKNPLEVTRINTFSWHRSNRSPQIFHLWGAAGETPPNPLFKRGDPIEWTFIAKVDSDPLGGGGIHGSMVENSNGPGEPIGTFRYLMWLTEDAWEGTFFTEIDVDAQ